MADKKHAPIGKLRDAARLADEILKDKGLVQKQSVIQEIEGQRDALVLPGPPGRRYIPPPWVINNARRVLYDVCLMYKNDVKEGKAGSKSIDDFFRYCAGVMRDVEVEARRKIAQTVREKKYDVKLLHYKDAAAGIKQLLIDSFAVSIVLKQNTDVANFVEWFMEWTERILEKYPENVRNADGKAKDGFVKKMSKIILP